MLPALLIALASSPSPMPSAVPPSKSEHVVSAPPSSPIGIYIPQPCGEIMMRAGIMGSIIDVDPGKTADNIGRIVARAIRDHNGDLMPVQTIAVLRALGDLMGTPGHPGCLHAQ